MCYTPRRVPQRLGPLKRECPMIRTVVSLALATWMSTTAVAAEDRTICVYDPAGEGGDAFRAATDFQTDALQKGYNLDLVAYTEEPTAAADLRAKKCDAALITGVRAGQFGVKTYAIEAMGAIQSYETLRSTVQLLGTPSAAPLMKAGAYEVMAIFPAGAVYLYVKDKNWTSKADLPGKKIATLDFDKAATKLVSTVGAQMVSADIGTFAGMFNNGSVDVCYAPATAYAPLELYRGLAGGGGIINYPISQLTLQLVARSDRFDSEFTAWARSYAAKGFDRSLKIVKAVEGRVDAKYWTNIPASARPEYDQLLRKVRVGLRDQGIYDGTMLKLMKRVRCKADASRAECADNVE